MELTPIQRQAFFVVIVLALAGLGWYLFRPAVPAASSAGRHPAAAGGVTRPLSAAQPGSSPSGSPSPSPGGGLGSGGLGGSGASPGGGSAAGSRAAPLSPSQTAAIYQWLPFTPAGLAGAARTVITFGDDYGTFSYDQNATAYLAPMRGLISSTLAEQLANAYSAAGVASLRITSRQVSTGTAAIIALRAFGPSSITFVVAVSQHMTDHSGRSELTVNYAVTAAGSAGSWQVSDIQLAAAGNS